MKIWTKNVTHTVLRIKIAEMFSSNNQKTVFEIIKNTFTNKYLNNGILSNRKNLE